MKVINRSALMHKGTNINSLLESVPAVVMVKILGNGVLYIQTSSSFNIHELNTIKGILNPLGFKMNDFNIESQILYFEREHNVLLIEGKIYFKYGKRSDILQSVDSTKGRKLILNKLYYCLEDFFEYKIEEDLLKIKGNWKSISKYLHIDIKDIVDILENEVVISIPEYWYLV